MLLQLGTSDTQTNRCIIEMKTTSLSLSFNPTWLDDNGKWAHVGVQYMQYIYEY